MTICYSSIHCIMSNLHHQHNLKHVKTKVSNDTQSSDVRSSLYDVTIPIHFLLLKLETILNHLNAFNYICTYKLCFVLTVVEDKTKELVTFLQIIRVILHHMASAVSQFKLSQHLTSILSDIFNPQSVKCIKIVSLEGNLSIVRHLEHLHNNFRLTMYGIATLFKLVPAAEDQSVLGTPFKS